jgi:hypothetical protein
MKTLTRTMIVLFALILMTAGFAWAQVTATPAEPAPTSSTNVSQTSAGTVQSQRDLNRLIRSVSLSPGRMGIGTGTGSTVLVIPSQEIKTEELLTINEDMNVMSRIFNDKLSQERLAGANIYGSFTGGRWASIDPFAMYMGRFGGTQSMYLQGYGALFLMSVDFPLAAGPETQEQEEEKTEKENTDQVWEQTKQQMYEPQEPGQGRRGAESQEVKYDPEKVENLKKSLIEAFKHAANIRVLKPDESVILSITGSGTSSKIISMQDLPGTNQTLVVQESGGKKITRVYQGDLPEDIKLSSPTMLVIRAKKSDIDSFAKGDLNLDKFREKVQILSYPLLDGNVAGATSTVFGTRSTGVSIY